MMIFAQRPNVLGLRDGPKSGISSGNVTPFAIFLTFCALGENVGSHKKNWNPGKSIIRIYIRFIDLPKMSRFFTARAKRGEACKQSTCAFWVTFLHTMKMMEFHETLLYKAIIHFPHRHELE